MEPDHDIIESGMAILKEELLYDLVSLGYLAGLILDEFECDCADALAHAVNVFGAAVDSSVAVVGLLGCDNLGRTCVKPFPLTKGQAMPELWSRIEQLKSIAEAGHEIWASS